MQQCVGDYLRAVPGSRAKRHVYDYTQRMWWLPCCIIVVTDQHFLSLNLTVPNLHPDTYVNRMTKLMLNYILLSIWFFHFQSFRSINMNKIVHRAGNYWCYLSWSGTWRAWRRTTSCRCCCHGCRCGGKSTRKWFTDTRRLSYRLRLEVSSRCTAENVYLSSMWNNYFFARQYR